MKKIRVLIADDVKKEVENIEKMLQKVPSVEVIATAHNGKEELEKILELQPDLVLTDNQMPELNGIDVIEKINNEYEEQCKSEFIIISSDSSIMVKAIQLGVFQIIKKPYTEHDLIKFIEDYISFADYKENKENEEKKEKIKIEKKSLFNKLLNKLKGK